MAGILKFFGGIVVEMLVRKGDYVSERTSRTGSGTLLRPTADQFGLAFVTSIFPQALLEQGACSRPAAHAVAFGHPAEHAGQRSP